MKHLIITVPIIVALSVGIAAVTDGNRSLRVAPGALPNSLKMQWRFKTGGPVTAAAAVADGKVYVGSTDRYVYAIRLSDGKKAWSFKTKDGVEAPPTVLN